MSKATNLAKGASGFLKIDVGIGMLLDTTMRNAKLFNQVFPDQVRRLTERVTDAEIDTGFAEINRV